MKTHTTKLIGNHGTDYSLLSKENNCSIHIHTAKKRQTGSKFDLYHGIGTKETLIHENKSLSQCKELAEENIRENIWVKDTPAKTSDEYSIVDAPIVPDALTFPRFMLMSKNQDDKGVPRMVLYVIDGVYYAIDGSVEISDLNDVKKLGYINIAPWKFATEITEFFVSADGEENGQFYKNYHG
jgi:hypothetical protein